MKRRLFLQTPLVATALIASAQNSKKDAAEKGIKVGNGEDRFREELLIMGGRFDCKVSAKDSNGDLCIYDTIRQAKGGPALHIHHRQDERGIRRRVPEDVGLRRDRKQPGGSSKTRMMSCVFVKEEWLSLQTCHACH